VSAKNEVSAAISLLGNSDWYQSGHMHAKSLMNELSRLQVELAEKDGTIARLQLEISTYDSCEQLTEIAELRARCEAAERDAERLRQFERWADDGFCPHLVFDDDGHWAVSFAGSGPSAQSDEITSHVAVVEPHEWSDSVGEAIDAALAAQYAAQRKEGGL
jgi:hypothetical protein